MRDPVFAVGTTVEVLRAEALSLAELAIQMRSVSRHQRPGWLGEYVRAHTQVNRLLHGIIERSH